MHVKFAPHFPVVLVVATLFIYGSSAQTITSNRTGTQGGYNYEYWKDNGNGTMTLGDGGDFSCNWSNVGNILFRKGLRPGSKDQIITYSANYNPSGNSYLSVYGWTTNPLVEYYIIESWGSWKPPGSVASKGTITSDDGTYDIYQNSRTGPSIQGNTTFQQYWSVRQSKHTSGTITCGNHFKAWESKGMRMGSLYEVSFVVEGYQSSGSADVKMSMGTPTGISINTTSRTSESNAAHTFGLGGQGQITVNENGPQTLSFTMPKDGYALLRVYNCRGQEITVLAEKKYTAGQHSIPLNVSHRAQGVYLYTVKVRD